LSHGYATPAIASTTVGYTRTPHSAVALEQLIAELRASGCETVFGDVANGAAIIRPGLDTALAALRPGDVLAVASLALLSWRWDGLWPIMSAVEKAGAHIVSATERLDTRDARGFFDTVRILDAFGVSVRAARKAEASASRTDSRRRIPDDAWAEVAPLVLAGSLSANDAARRLQVNRSTVYRRLETGI